MALSRKSGSEAQQLNPRSAYNHAAILVSLRLFRSNFKEAPAWVLFFYFTLFGLVHRRKARYSRSSGKGYLRAWKICRRPCGEARGKECSGRRVRNCFVQRLRGSEEASVYASDLFQTYSVRRAVSLIQVRGRQSFVVCFLCAGIALVRISNSRCCSKPPQSKK